MEIYYIREIEEFIPDYYEEIEQIFVEAKELERKVKIMTKKEMINIIEITGMVIDFDRNYLMGRSKKYIQGLYIQALEFQKNSSKNI